MNNQTELLHNAFPHLRQLTAFERAHTTTPWLDDSEAKNTRKLCQNMEDAIRRRGLQDGMTI